MYLPNSDIDKRNKKQRTDTSRHLGNIIANKRQNRLINSRLNPYLEINDKRDINYNKAL